MDWHVLLKYQDQLLTGLRMTVMLSAGGIVGSFALGTVLGCLAASGGELIPRMVRMYIEVMRNLPMIVKLAFLYFAVGLDAIPSALLALTLHQGAYISDVMASGFRGIPREQSEAAITLGHRRHEVFLFVLLPQVFRFTVPPLTNQFIEVVKNSAICMLIGIEELTFMTQNIDHETFRGFEAATAVTMLYLAMAIGIGGAMSLAQRRLFRGMDARV